MMNDKSICSELFAGSRKKSRVSAHTVREWHAGHVNALRDRLDALPEGSKKWIVMTHHPPRGELATEFKEQPFATGYINDLKREDRFDSDDFAVWLSAHTHVFKDLTVDGIRCISNCMGYPGQKTGYRPDFVLPYENE